MKKDELIQTLKLYAVTDRSWLSNENYPTVALQVEQAIKGGATFIQLREKALDEDEFFDEGKEVQKVCKKYNVPFVVNDNVELAVRLGADGVHVGQSDMKAKDVRKLIGEGKVLGVSAQTVEQAVAAEKAGADYLGVGAIFTTYTKDSAESVSIRTLREICSAVSIPVVAIGGICRDNVKELEGSGIVGISVISAIFSAKDIQSATENLLMEAEKYF